MKVIKWLIGLFVVFTVIAIPVRSYYGTTEVVSGTVTDKYVKNSKDKSDFFVVLDGKPYKNTDDVFLGKWNSADVQAKLKVGDNVKVKIVGYRNEFFSIFPNVAEVK